MDAEIEPVITIPTGQVPEIRFQDFTITESIILQEQIQSLTHRVDSALRENNDLKDQLKESRAMHEHTSRELHTIRRQHTIASDTVLSLRTALSEVTHGPAGDNVDHPLAYQQRRIMSLERLLEETRASASFAQLGVGDSFGPAATDIQISMKIIDSEIRNLMISFHSGSTFCIPQLEGHGRLSLLVHRSLGLASQRPESSTPSAANLETLGLRATISTLIAAALGEWVFGDGFELNVVGSSKLLEEYRYHLSLIGDHQSRRNLDLAANRSFFNSEEYQKIWIPNHARILATRFSVTLAPLFPTPDEPNDTQGHPTWGLDPDEWYLVYEGLVVIFQRALSLKVDLFLSTHQYVAVFFPPRAEFVNDWMQPESKNGDRAIQVPGGYLELQLCVLPALFVRTEGSLELVDHKVPILADISDDDGLRLVHKGVVILSSMH
ncbi:hypothetical protein BDW59DRAFT_140213 [Aspergillus cavernicola]|uniref:Uncharacterized protein n=1 Tax=Aspergillus cavernicola TaxID=176166 RepID=A0ABR4IUN6_9EURO